MLATWRMSENVGKPGVRAIYVWRSFQWKNEKERDVYSVLPIDISFVHCVAECVD